MKRGVVALASLVAVACGGGTTTIGPDPVGQITLTCPSDIRIDNVAGPTRAVTYAAPTATGGVPPIAISCSIASGAAFVLGSTVVTCSGTDGIRIGQCGFTVTLVAAVPMLRVTTFLAFGDSITAGENGEPDLLPMFLDIPNSYEVKLQALLTQRYTAQTPTVILDGVGRETAVEGAARISGDLTAFRPDVLLLLEGVNDLSGNLASDQKKIVDSLRFDIQVAKGRGVIVFLSTLLPEDERPGNRAHDSNELPSVNAAIRSLAVEQNVTLVDTNAAYGIHGVVGDYLDADGLHPTAAGNLATAHAFFTAIQTTLEVPISLSGRAGLGPSIR